MSGVQELDGRIRQAAKALEGTDYTSVVKRCRDSLLTRSGISREERRVLDAAYTRLIAALHRLTGRVVNLVNLIRMTVRDTMSDRPRLAREFCGQLELEAGTSRLPQGYSSLP